MSFRRGLFVLVGCVFGSISVAQQVTPGLQVSGVANNRDGKFFAIVKGIGVVQKGDIILSPVDGVIYKYHVLSVDIDGMEVRKIATTSKASEVDPKRKYELRDPFWPIDYDSQQ